MTGKFTEKEAMEIYNEARRDLVRFYKIFLSDGKRVKSPKFHYEISRILLNDKNSFAIEAFRESGKSSIVLQAFPHYALLYPSENRDYVIFIKENQTLAENKLTEVVRSYTTNPFFMQNVVRIKEQSRHSFEVEVRSGNKIYPIRFEAYGKGASIRGLAWGTRRPKIIIIDDPQNSVDMESEVIPEKDWNWFLDDVLFLGKEARVFLIGNNLGEKCIIERVKAQSEALKFQTITMPALDDQGQPTWKEMFSAEFLEEEKQSYILMGKLDVWYRNRMCVAMSDENRTFKSSYFQYYDPSLLKDNLEIIGFVDPAISLKQSADFSAFITIGRDKKTNKVYLLDVYHAKVEPDDLIDNIFWGYDKWRHNVIGIESVQYQKMLILEVKKQMNIRNKFFNLESVAPRGEKHARIKSILQARYSNHNILHTKLNCGIIEEELLAFPHGAHDDAIDALAGAVSLLGTNNHDQVKDNAEYEYALQSLIESYND